MGGLYLPCSDILHQPFRETLTINHGENVVQSLLAGHPRGDDLHRHPVALVGLQLSDDVGAGVPPGASGVDQPSGVLVKTLNGVGVIVSLRGRPRAGDGGGALWATVETVDSFWLCRKTTGIIYTQFFVIN